MSSFCKGVSVCALGEEPLGCLKGSSPLRNHWELEATAVENKGNFCGSNYSPGCHEMLRLRVRLEQ